MQNIKNIIFDFGEVIINIAPEAVSERLAQKGIHHLEERYRHLLDNNVYVDFETGAIGPKEFRNAIRNFLQLPLGDEEIDEVWNAMILGFQPDTIKLLTRLREEYRMFLLSNTNAIHEVYYNNLLHIKYGIPNLTDIFEKVYYSHDLNMRKPDHEIFQHVLADSRLNARETLYIDDTEVHVKAAGDRGMHAYHLRLPQRITEVLC